MPFLEVKPVTSPTPADTRPKGESATPTEPAATATAEPKGGSEGPAELMYIFDTPADPITVTPMTDNEGAVEAMIATTGGTVSVNSVDGTVFTLEIPADALVVDTLIRMTPISKVDGMPFGSVSYAVQLEPQGLQFYEAAILKITPTEGLPVDQEIFCGYQGENNELGLAAPVEKSAEIQIQVMHFSGYGVAKGLLADIEPVRARIGGDAEARLQSALAEQLTRARQAQLLGDQDSAGVDWESFFQQYQEQVIKPRVAAAGESCAAGRLALQTVLGFERTRRLLGLGDDSTAGSPFAGGLMDTVAEVCMREEYELCRDDHVIHRIVPAWLGLARQYALLGIAEEGAQPAALENAKAYVVRCLSFEMEFHSEGRFSDGDGGYDSTVDAKIKIRFIPEELKLQGQSPLVNTAFEFRIPGCNVSSNRGGDTFEAMSLSYITDAKSPTDALGYVRDFTFVYYPGNTQEYFTYTCPDLGSQTVPATSLWTGIYLITHQDEMSQADGGIVARDWEILGGETYAKKAWILESAGDGIVEAGTFKLYHRPQ